MSNLQTVIVCGYAQTGKTTLLTQLEKLGYHCYSSSLEVKRISCELLDIPRADHAKYINFFYNKVDHPFKELSLKVAGEVLSARDLQIYLTENVYIPKHGRIGLVKRTLERQPIPDNYDKPYVFVESAGGEEGQHFIDLSKYPSVAVNMRSRIEKPGIDIRKLMKGKTFMNPMISEEDTLEKFFEILES